MFDLAKTTGPPAAGNGSSRSIYRRAASPLLVAVFISIFAVLSAAQTTPKTEPEVPYVPTEKRVVDVMLKLAKVKRSDVVYDLGCGDGRIVITAARKYGARGVGIDIDPVRIKEANANARKAGVTDKVRFIEADLFGSDFREATVVALYLLPDINLKLRPILLEQLKPGTRIVSNHFTMGEWKPEKSVNINGRMIHLWTVPADKKIPEAK
jgi:SAM-dependent methyltransferase